MQSVRQLLFAHYFCGMARPKSDDPPQTFCIRLTGELRAKFTEVAKAQRRKPSELLRMLAEDAVAAHEAKHGEIKLPE
jgi:hypothetical protein